MGDHEEILNSANAPGLIGDAYRSSGLAFSQNDRLTAQQLQDMLCATGRAPQPDVESGSPIDKDDPDARLYLMGRIQALLGTQWMHAPDTSESIRAFAEGYTSSLIKYPDIDAELTPKQAKALATERTAAHAVTTEIMLSCARLLAGMEDREEPRWPEREGIGMRIARDGITAVSEFFTALLWHHTISSDDHRSIVTLMTTWMTILNDPCISPHMHPPGTPNCDAHDEDGGDS